MGTSGLLLLLCCLSTPVEIHVGMAVDSTCFVELFVVAHFVALLSCQWANSMKGCCAMQSMHARISMQTSMRVLGSAFHDCIVVVLHRERWLSILLQFATVLYALLGVCIALCLSMLVLDGAVLARSAQFLRVSNACI